MFKIIGLLVFVGMALVVFSPSFVLFAIVALTIVVSALLHRRNQEVV